MTSILGRRPISQLRGDLQAICSDGVAFSLMVGIGESYLPAFVLALGMGEVAAGLIATVPMLAGSLLQLISPWALRRMASYRRWVVCCALLQAASLLLMLGMALVASIPPWLVFVPATLYWAAGMATGPAWNTWVEYLVPRRIRATFFAGRVRLSHISVLVGLVCGGLLLRYSGTYWSPLTAFACLFAIAAASRIYSASRLASQSEPGGVLNEALERSELETLSPSRFQGPRALVFYLVSVQVAVYMAAPYFTPFMLKKLELNYLEYMSLMACGFLGKILTLPAAGRIARAQGADRLLWLGGIGIVPVSALWLVSGEMWFLVGLQLLSGAMWSFYELGMLLLFFERIPRHQRVAILTAYNVANSVAMVAGALLGAAVMSGLGGTHQAYLAVFVLSSLGRAATLVLLPPASGTITVRRPRLLQRVLAVRPAAGSIERPIIATLPSSPMATLDVPPAAPPVPPLAPAYPIAWGNEPSADDAESLSADRACA